MTRFDFTNILAPGALQPRTRGPREGGTDIAPLPPTVPLHTPLGKGTTKAAPPATPTQAVHFTPRPGVVIEAAPKPKGKPMRANTQQAVLDALNEHGPLNRITLGKKSGLTDKQLGQALFNLKKSKRIATNGPQNNRLYGIPGTKFPAADASPPPKAEKPKKQAPEKKKSTPAKAAKPSKALAVSVGYAPRVPATIANSNDIRAIRTHDGGAIVLQGGFLVNELTADQTRAVQALQ